MNADIAGISQIMEEEWQPTPQDDGTYQDWENDYYEEAVNNSHHPNQWVPQAASHPLKPFDQKVDM